MKGRPMTSAELLAAFPNCAVAVELCEFHNIPNILRATAAAGANPFQVLVEAVEEALAEDDGLEPNHLRRAREQFRTEEFGRYLAGRFGPV